jgi:hypothetical protein
MGACDKYNKKNADADVRAVKKSFLSNNKAFEDKEKLERGKFWENAHKQIFDNTGKLKRQMRKQLGARGEILIRNLELSAGGSAIGDVQFQNAFAKVFSGLKKNEYEYLNEIIQARRNIALETNRVVVARQFLNDNAIGTVFDLSNQDHVSVLNAKYGEAKIKKFLGKQFVTIQKKNADTNNSEIILQAHISANVATKFADIQVRKVLASADILNPDGLSAAQYQKFLDHAKKFDGTNFDRLNGKADNYFAVFKSQLGHMRRAGLIDEKTFNHMRKVGDYSPRRYIQFFDPDITFNNLEPITTGSTQALMMDSAVLMRDYIVRLHERIAKNEANVSLYNFAKDNPGNGIAEVVGVDDIPRANTIRNSAFIDGNRVAVVMPLELGKEWGGIDSGMDKELADMLSKYSGSKFVRVLATGANPEFALTNFPRDIMFSWFRTREFSDAAPIALGQMVKQFASTFKDVWHTGATPIGKAKDFLEDGGMMEFMTTQGALEKNFRSQSVVMDPRLRAIEKALSFLGQKTELWVRLALRQQALDNGKSRKDATWIARSYLDFSQGGKAVKVADKALPYLNAGLQATRGMFGSLLLGDTSGAKEFDRKKLAKNKAAAMFKFFQFGLLFSSVMINNILHHPEAWDKTDDQDKTKNLLLYTGLSHKAANGSDVYSYVKIPLDQGQSGVGSFFGSIITKFLKETIGTEGDTVFHKIAGTRQEVWNNGMANLVPFSNFIPPTLKAAIATQNIDTYMWREISHKGELNDNTLEQTPFTHPFFVMSAEKLNDMFGVVTDSKPFSPERMRVMADSLIPSSNSMIKVLGGLGRIGTDLINGDPQEQAIKAEIEQSWRQAIKSIPGADRIFEYTNDESIEVRAQADKAKVKSRTTEIRVKTLKNKWMNHLNGLDDKNTKAQEKVVRTAATKIRDMEAKGDISRDSMNRHIESVNRSWAIKKRFGKIKNPRLWRNVSFAPSGEPRASMIFAAIKAGNEKQKQELLEQFRRFKFIGNKKTVKELTKLLREDARN